MKEKIKKLTISVIISGCIVFIVGCYYAVVKAGIPYQDPTMEMQIQYAIYTGIGDELVKLGFVIIVLAILIHVIIKKAIK